MIPDSLTHSDFLRAARDIDENGVPNHRKSYRYFLVLNGKEYPPKYIITHAYELKKGEELPHDTFHAVEAKNYFFNNGYEIITKDNISSEIADEDGEKYYSEGKEKYRMHRGYERDTRVAKQAKQKALEEEGVLKCEACGFSYSDVYGELGSGYIEAHHTIPVSQLGEKGKTSIEDIALLCSNCHKMIHRANPMKTVDELRGIINLVTD